MTRTEVKDRMFKGPCKRRHRIVNQIVVKFSTGPSTSSSYYRKLDNNKTNLLAMLAFTTKELNAYEKIYTEMIAYILIHTLYKHDYL